MKKGAATFIILLGLSLILAACATDSGGQKNLTPPAWLTTLPADNTYWYFVGAGENQMSIGDAQEKAYADAMSRLFSLIGQQVTSVLSSQENYTKSGNAEDYKFVLDSILKAEGKGNIKDFAEFDRWMKTGENGVVSLYILFRVPKTTVAAEQERLRKLWEEQVNFFLVPEDQGKIALSSGNYWDAAMKFYTAAKNVTTTAYENKGIVFERDLGQMLSILANMTATLTIPPGTVEKGKPSQTPVTYTVSYNDNGTMKPVPNMPMKFIYPVLSGNQLSTVEFKTFTDEKGIAYFRYDRVPVAGNLQIFAATDTTVLLFELKKLAAGFSITDKDSKFNSAVNSISALNKSGTMTAVSQTQGDNTLVVLVVTDETGAPTNPDVTGLYKALSSFKTPFVTASIMGPVDAKALFAQTPGVKRIIAVTGSVTGTSTYSGKQVAKVKLTMTVYYSDRQETDVFTADGNMTGDTVKAAVILSIKQALDQLASFLQLII